MKRAIRQSIKSDKVIDQNRGSQEIDPFANPSGQMVNSHQRPRFYSMETNATDLEDEESREPLEPVKNAIISDDQTRHPCPQSPFEETKVSSLEVEKERVRQSIVSDIESLLQTGPSRNDTTKVSICRSVLNTAKKLCQNAKEISSPRRLALIEEVLPNASGDQMTVLLFQTSFLSFPNASKEHTKA